MSKSASTSVPSGKSSAAPSAEAAPALASVARQHAHVAAPASVAASQPPLRVLMALPGLHRVSRGAENALQSIATELVRTGDAQVTLVGSGQPRPGTAYRFVHAPCLSRERFDRWPTLPVLRNACAYEEAGFAFSLSRWLGREPFDVTLSCSYPFVNWTLRAFSKRMGSPAQIHVTQNGDWPAFCRKSEFRFFHCDGLVCTNPVYFKRNADRWRSVLVPNGVDAECFKPGPCQRAALGIPPSAVVVLMVSALIPCKRVLEAIDTLAEESDFHLVVAGDGPLRAQVEHAGRSKLGRRFQLVMAPPAIMPELYRAADVFLHMNPDEPSSLACLEALATGLPVVAHDNEASRWTFEQHACLVDVCSPTQVRQALHQVLLTRSDSHVQARRELVLRRFTWRQIARSYLEFARSVLHWKGAAA